MPDSPTLEINGVSYRPVDADFTIKHEDWCEYEIDDGTSVRVRLIARRISTLESEDGAQLFNDDGSPYVLVDWNVTIVASRDED